MVVWPVTLRDVVEDLAKKPTGRFGVVGSTDARLRPTASGSGAPGPGMSPGGGGGGVNEKQKNKIV